MSNVSRAYAQATFSHATALNALDNWHEKMLLLRDLKHPALKNPLTSETVISTLTETLMLSEDQTQWLHTLKKDNCLHLLGKIANRFVSLVQDHRRTIPVTLTTARSLTEQEQQQFTQTIAKMFKHEVILSFSIRPEIIGGVQLEHSGKLIDLSYVKVLNQLHT